jgi:cation diffusion facilitator CzcD-associated flavoprotein CzcO/ketosteroid isomerase-like protein
MVSEVTRWLADFEHALAASDVSALEALFRPDAHWRDLVAFTWNVKTVSGVAQIANQLAQCEPPRGFELDRRRTPPRQVTRAGTKAIEAFYRFETDRIRGQGVVRFIPDGGRYQCWTFLTALDELKGFEENIESRRPKGEAYSRDFRGPNWLDLRKAALRYEDREPTVLVVGGGHAGLSIAVRLKQLNIDTLIVDRNKRVGDNWRNRYHALTLHNQVQVNHLPYMPFPPNWPTYIPKDKLANWFEAYVESLELDFWTENEFAGATYDSGVWTAQLRQPGGTRIVRPRHIVMATGVSGIPKRADIPSLKNFKGRVLHSHEYQSAAEWKGRDTMVIGTGNSGHDIAQDLYSNGARVTLVQRSPTLIVQIEPSAQLPYALYSEGLPTEECDLIAASMPMPLQRKAHTMMTAQGRELDKPLLDALTKAGFKLDTEDPTGWQFKYLTRGGGYYFNVGCSELIVERKIRLVLFSDIETFVADGARLRNGDLIPSELSVTATGYYGLQNLVRKLFGDAVAERVGPVWGIDEEEQELRNMWKPTGQPGLWFIAGSFAQARIYSKYLALQIKAAEERLVASRTAREEREAVAK